MDNILCIQLITLIRFILTGILIGVLFDIFRSLRRAIKIPDIITYIQDTLFWIISGMMIIYTVINYTDGVVRAYMFLGILLGAILYFALLSQCILKIITKFFLSICFPLKKFNKLIKKD